MFLINVQELLQRSHSKSATLSPRLCSRLVLYNSKWIYGFRFRNLRLSISKKSTLCFHKGLDLESESTKDMTAIGHVGTWSNLRENLYEISQYRAETCWKLVCSLRNWSWIRYVRPSPAAWHALVLLPKRDECRRDASPANLKSQMVSVCFSGFFTLSWHHFKLRIFEIWWSLWSFCFHECCPRYVPCIHVLFPSNRVLVTFVQGLHSLCHGWVMKDTQKTIGDFGTLNEVPAKTTCISNTHLPGIHKRHTLGSNLGKV